MSIYSFIQVQLGYTIEIALQHKFYLVYKLTYQYGADSRSPSYSSLRSFYFSRMDIMFIFESPLKPELDFLVFCQAWGFGG